MAFSGTPQEQAFTAKLARVLDMLRGSSEANGARRSGGLFLALVPIILAFAAACASAQITPNQPSKLPDAVLGAFTPHSRNYWSLGELVVRRDTLSWGTCVEVPYRLLATRGAESLIQLLRSPPCVLRGESSFLILERSSRFLEVAICGEKAEFDRERRERSCSWGTLAKKD
jgi:hypothetical protein